MFRYEGAVQNGPSTEDYLTGKATPMDKDGVGISALASGLGQTMGEQVTMSMVGELPEREHIVCMCGIRFSTYCKSL